MKNCFIKLSVFIFALALIVPSIAKAVYTDEETGASVGVRVLVSKNGTDWVNFSNSNGEPSGQTLVVSPGETIYFKGEVWNAGEATAYPLLVAYIKNAKYLENIGAFENSEGYDDLDEDGIYYQINGSSQTDEYVSMYLNFSDYLTKYEPEVGTQSGMIQATVADNVPQNTIIEGYLVLIYPYYMPDEVTPQDAFTDAMDMFPEQSKVRILVNPTADGKVLSATDVLPQTGGLSNSKNIQIYLLFAAASLIFMYRYIKFETRKK
jgi:hypothetical protein